MQKIIFISLILLIALFVTDLKYGNGGQTEDKNTLTQISQQNLLNESLAVRNSMMDLKISGLKGSLDALEARARYELNLVKPGETLVILPGNYNIKVPNKKSSK
jgi:cell division protein FtsB